MPSGSGTALLAVLLPVALGLALVIFVSREFWLWYFMIRDRRTLEIRQVELLEGIRDELVTFRNERNRFRKTA